MIKIKNNEYVVRDNTAYYNDSLAYDFAMFEPKEKKPRENITPIKQNKKNKNRKSIMPRPQALTCWIIFFSFVLATALFSLYLRAEITVVSNQIYDLKTQINELEAEKTQLEMQLTEKISYTNLSKAATELGMQKCRKGQVVYIQIHNKDACLTQKEIKAQKNNKNIDN